MKSLAVFWKPMTLVFLVLLTVYLLNPFNLGYLIGYLIACLILLQGSFLAKNLDLDFVLLLLFSSTYALFYAFDYESRGAQYIAIFAITPPFFYLLGKYLVRDNIHTKSLFFLLFAISIIFSTTAAISVFINFLKGGFVQLERTIGMFWDNSPTSATIMGSFFTLNMCIPALLIIGVGKKIISFKVLAIVVFIISLICCIRLGSRTQLGIFLITSVLSILYIIPKQNSKQNLMLFFVLGGIGYFISTKVSFDLDADWLTTFADRMEGKNTGIASGGGRTERWVKSLEYLFKYPLGWDVNEFGFAHNFWLDVLRASGIVPFIILIIYTIRSFMQLRKTLGMIKDDIIFKGQILIYFFAFMMIFMVEPVMEGIFMTFIVFCIYKGIINKYRDTLQSTTGETP
ncbi:hypothetical protein DZC72_14345 [Maribacter algicola]|uniref:O-antigen ligase domain-containing protein n=1 Tax=Maribacter algicola TaxID=2498892 RepID=A0A426RIP0_9FLAO|nr:hypothetical protein [Maribacter algicola]RRQ48843.1 hypothetical protein DZC72_14345 [Maribacter algicola]